MKVFIDLYAGLGGGSEAFHQDPTWRVIRIDNNPDLLPYCHGLNLGDITDIPATLAIIKACMPAEVERLVVWASPPCLEFSMGYNAPGPTAQRDGQDFQPDMRCLEAALEIINALKPDEWFIENVRGAIVPFTATIGHQYRQQLGSFFLWGHFPQIALRSASMRNHTKPDARHNPLRSNVRACVPFDYSQAIKAALDDQTSLALWLN